LSAVTVSVALATYNGARFLPAQLGSIAAQTRRPDEIVVGDDLSQDDTEGVLNRFGRDSGIPVRFTRNVQRAKVVTARSVMGPVRNTSVGHIVRATDKIAAPEKPAAAAAANGNGNGTGTHKAGRVMASPASRRRAAEAGLDLATVAGTGREGRIEPGDIDSALAAGAARGAPPSMNARANATRDVRNGTEEVKIIGLRRVIAERLTESAKSIPQYSYVEEIDLTRLEALRKHLNDRRPAAAPPLTFLPFIVAALARVLGKFPQCNALYDAARGVLVKHNAVHVGIATQTPQGLKVPVVRNAESRALHDLAAEIRRVSEAARANKSPREELTGSTITVTSLGKLGGIASTPMINMPEVAIIGVNKAIERAVVVDGQICVRLMMNLSSSFDHRFVDGYDCASMIQALKDLLEQPATIFID